MFFLLCLTVKNNIQIRGHHPADIVIYNTTNSKIKYQNSPILKANYREQQYLLGNYTKLRLHCAGAVFAKVA